MASRNIVTMGFTNVYIEILKYYYRTTGARIFVENKNF